MNSKRKGHRLHIVHGNVDDTQVKALTQQWHDEEFVEIALNYNNITDKGCRDLLTYVNCHPNIKSLELFGNKLSDGSCGYLAHTLMASGLARLKLGDNCITAKGAALLAGGLRNNSSLIQLHLGGNQLCDEGLVVLATALLGNTTLTSLGLRDNNIRSTGITALSLWLSRPSCPLSEVQLKGNQIGDEGAAALGHAISTNTSLKVLEVPSNQLTAFAAEALCNGLRCNTSIHALNWNDNLISDFGAVALGGLLETNQAITTIGINGNNIQRLGTAALANALRSNHTLTGLDLGANKIGNEGACRLADALEVNSTLISLDVHSNNIQLQGIQALATALARDNCTLRHLDVGSNYSRNTGAVAWAQVIAKNTTLTRLCLTDNEIGPWGGEVLLHSARRNTTLRNFSFGGQSQSHPLANDFSAFTRRGLNRIIHRNKELYEQQLLAAEVPEVTSFDRREGKHLVNSYSNRPLELRTALKATLQPPSMEIGADSPYLAAVQRLGRNEAEKGNSSLHDPVAVGCQKEPCESATLSLFSLPPHLTSPCGESGFFQGSHTLLPNAPSSWLPFCFPVPWLDGPPATEPMDHALDFQNQ